MFRIRTALAAIPLAALAFVGPTQASHTAAPTSVTIAGSLQSELGCPGDWDPGCAQTHLDPGADDGVWKGTFALPAGDFEYKAALNDSWDENYGLHAAANGDNIPLSLGSPQPVRFYYDPQSHWVADSATSTIVTAAGSFQSELGCPGDWDPGCLRSWLEDPDGDGTYTFDAALPAGSYEAKAALNEAWDVNYGAGGAQNGDNIQFTVAAGQTTHFSFDPASHVLTITTSGGETGSDDNVEWDGLRHDSRSTLYRAPGGAVPAGTPTLIRFRTFHDDVTGVKLRLYDVNANAQRLVSMTRAASGVSCFQPGLESRTCDYWQAKLDNAAPDDYWYRFVVTDGSKTVYYADDTPALDGGLGAPSDDLRDWSWALTVYDPGFTTPDWAKSAVIYQIFPDRFRDGVPGNDPVPGAGARLKTGFALSKDPRYGYPGGDQPTWDQIVQLPWTAKPEGYCQSYATPDDTCMPRFPAPAGREGPRGRDYFGGDLVGITQKLDYLQSLGVTALYLNPIFDAASDHGYDTQDYRKIDPYFGTEDQFRQLVAAAKARGMRVILDGVFNHASSDSPWFDRYHHYATTGACESTSSPFRSWFTFTSSTTPCGAADYASWFGFDSLPVLDKANPAVQHEFVDGPDSIAATWLKRGASGWRLDVMGDASFPDGYWQTFRRTVKATDPDALIVGELWQKDTTQLRLLRGDQADTTMNYRLRDAVLGLLAPGPFDAKGFADSGHELTPSQFAARIASIQEDLAPQAAYTAMDLLDSHDTARLLWTLTPGAATPAAREQDAANVAEGKRRLELASLVQFTMPGAPTIYYGDEVGVTGADDPDNRRTYPWADEGGHPDTALLDHYRQLSALRHATPALAGGDLRILLADDADGVVAYGRKTAGEAAVVVLNRSGSERTVDVPVAGYLPDGFSLERRYGGGGSVTVSGGTLHVTVGALGGAVLAGDGDLAPPAAPAGLTATAGNGSASLAWNAVDGAASYAVYRSPVSGGGYVKVGETGGTSFSDTGAANAQRVYYVVRALDAAGNESGDSNEATVVPHVAIGWANLQWPPTLTHTISVVDRTDAIYGQVWIDGVTGEPGPAPSLTAQLGFGPAGSSPDGNDAWTWEDASFNTDVGSNDEYVGTLLPEQVGSFDYAYRYSTDGGGDWVYADLDGIANGYDPAQAGKLTVVASGDTTAPATPEGLHVVSASPAGIELAWDPVTGDPSLYGYELLRDDGDGAFAQVARVTGASATDTDVAQGSTYRYAVRSLDTSFNRSPASAPVQAAAELREVTVTFTVTVPSTTDATGKDVHIAGTLDRLDPPGPQWDAAATPMTRLDATHWQIALKGEEGTQLEYKYALGSFDFVEKDASCGEIANRTLTLAYGSNGTQAVADTVPNWRNVAPCGN
jgi:glycosidase